MKSNYIMKYIVLLLTVLIFSSCHNLDPKSAQNEIEDCLRFELSTKGTIQEMTSMREFFSSIGVSGRFETEVYSLEDYKKVLSYIWHAKKVHNISSFYSTFDYLWLNLDAYESYDKTVQKYRKVIDDMKIDYNKYDLDLTPMEKIGWNRYFMKDRTSGAECVITVKGNDINVDINTDTE